MRFMGEPVTEEEIEVTTDIQTHRASTLSVTQIKGVKKSCKTFKVQRKIIKII